MGSADNRQNDAGTAIALKSYLPSRRCPARRDAGEFVSGPFFVLVRNGTALLLVILLLSAGLLPTPQAHGSAGDPPPLPSSLLQNAPVHSTQARASVPVSITIAGPAEISELRLYFKVMAARHYLFTPMTASDDGTFIAALPPAKNDTKGIDYFFLLQNTRGESRKTKPFRLLVLNDYTSPPPSPGNLEAQSEQPFDALDNLDFAVPLRVTPTSLPLLATAVEDPYPLLADQGPAADGGKRTASLSGLGAVSFSIKVGGVGFFYRGFSSH